MKWWSSYSNKVIVHSPLATCLALSVHLTPCLLVNQQILVTSPVDSNGRHPPRLLTVTAPHQITNSTWSTLVDGATNNSRHYCQFQQSPTLFLPPLNRITPADVTSADNSVLSTQLRFNTLYYLQWTTRTWQMVLQGLQHTWPHLATGQQCTADAQSVRSDKFQSEVDTARANKLISTSQIQFWQSLLWFLTLSSHIAQNMEILTVSESLYTICPEYNQSHEVTNTNQ